MLRADVERPKRKLIAGFIGAFGHQSKFGVRELLPDLEVLGRNGHISKAEHVSARFAHFADLCPRDLVHVKILLGSEVVRYFIQSERDTSFRAPDNTGAPGVRVVTGHDEIEPFGNADRAFNAEIGA